MPAKFPATAALFLASIACTALPAVAQESLPRVGVGDVIDGNAVILVRPAAGTGTVTVEVARDAGFSKVISSQSLSVTNALVPGKIFLSGLESNRRYHIRVTDGALVRTATFLAGAASIGTNSAPAGLRFGVTGDWRGDVGIYTAILNADERELDFFVKLGDTI